jgi:hypothetical protein
MALSLQVMRTIGQALLHIGKTERNDATWQSIAFLTIVILKDTV